MPFKSGFVAIIGRPNAGKSTLVNKLVGQKVAIVSPRPQTTRNRINGIFNRPDAQIVLVDTPGIHKPTSALNRQMMEQVESAMDGIDLLAMMVDATEGPDPDERLALERVRRFDGASYLLLNKVDRMAKERRSPAAACHNWWKAGSRGCRKILRIFL
jgi:GTPase